MRINFIYPEESEVKYHIDTYPDSQTHLVLEGEINRREKLDVYTRLSNLNDLWILMQLSDICQRQGIIIDTIYVSYLFAARTDRLFSFNEALDLELVKKCLVATNADSIAILEIHSSRICHSEVKPDIYSSTFEHNIPKNAQVVFPDEGAWLRYSYYIFDNPVITATKKRVSKDKIEITLNTSLLPNRPVYVVDDLCDGGGTFKALYNVLKENGAKEVHLTVCHAIQKKALIELSQLYKTITISNSYKDWDKEELPSNIKIIKVYE